MFRKKHINEGASAWKADKEKRSIEIEMSLLEIRNLKVKVDNHEILKGIDLEINPGEVHSIMGPNGSGKSTLVQVLARRENYDVTTAELVHDGKDLWAKMP